MMEKIDSCHLTFAQGWISYNMIFENLYEGALTCTTVLVVKLQTMKFRIDTFRPIACKQKVLIDYK